MNFDPRKDATGPLHDPPVDTTRIVHTNPPPTTRPPIRAKIDASHADEAKALDDQALYTIAQYTDGVEGFDAVTTYTIERVEPDGEVIDMSDEGIGCESWPELAQFVVELLEYGTIDDVTASDLIAEILAEVQSEVES